MVNYSLQEFETMVLLNFDLLRKKYGSMAKSMILGKNLWYYTEKYGTSIKEGKKMMD